MRGLIRLFFWLLFLAFIGMLVILFLPVILVLIVLQMLFGVRVLRTEQWNRFRHRPDSRSEAEAQEAEENHIPASEDVIDAEAVDLPDDSGPEKSPESTAKSDR